MRLQVLKIRLYSSMVVRSRVGAADRQYSALNQREATAS